MNFIEINPTTLSFPESIHINIFLLAFLNNQAKTSRLLVVPAINISYCEARPS
jgi:hypothetical protein